MGVPFYFYVIAKTYPGILRSDKPVCDVFYMDFNGAIHPAAQKAIREAKSLPRPVDLEDAIMKSIWKDTKALIAIANPSIATHLCIDGVAPIAKMAQQRNRRFLSSFRARNSPTPPVWDTNAISPGTPFMEKLQTFLMNQIGAPNSPTSIFLSGANEPGEGEHKIFQKIQDATATAAAESESAILIHGLDADLIFLSLLSHRKGITLMRENAARPGQAAAPATGPQYLNIDALRAGILKSLSDSHKWYIPDTVNADPFALESHAILETYASLCFLLGNDFIPHIPWLDLRSNGYETILRAASPVMSSESSANIQTSEVLASVLVTLAKTEDRDAMKKIEEHLRAAPRRGGPAHEDPLDAYPLMNKDPVAAKLLASDNWRPLYYKTFFFTRMHDTTVIAKACRAYIQGIYWTLRYYKRQKKDPNWFYGYAYPPTLRDLANYVNSLQSDDIKEMLSTFTVSPDDPRTFVSSDVQLRCIMPKSSSGILPPSVQKMMVDPKLGCTHLYPSDFKILTFLKTHLWECAVVLPMIEAE